MIQTERLRFRQWFLLAIAIPGVSQAGMPSLTLTDAAAARLDVISFFLLVFFLSAWLLKWAWNTLAKDFVSLPRFRYKHALGLLIVCSLFLYVILTMISGARELMTPGAWVKTGATYQLASPERDSKTWLDSARRSALENLRDALWRYAAAHDGNLPPHKEVAEIPSTLWSGIHPENEPLAFVPAGKIGAGTTIVAYEPDAYGGSRYCLLLDGAIIRLAAADLRQRLLSELKEPQS
jgi:hypothetical protein